MSFVNVAIGGMTALNARQQGRIANTQSQAAASQADYQAQVEQANAMKTAEVIRRAGRRQIGQATAAYAGAGVKVGEGSAGEVERQIGQDVEADAFQALLEGGRRAGALRTDATLTRISGEMQQSAGYVNAATSVLAGAYQGARANGWRTGGPGFSGQQRPAPVDSLTIKVR
jgi:hypothetical protein